MDWSKAGWKLFCACIGEWQETYINQRMAGKDNYNFFLSNVN